jgi:hypothetical protein
MAFGLAYKTKGLLNRQAFFIFGRYWFIEETPFLPCHSERNLWVKIIYSQPLIMVCCLFLS